MILIILFPVSRTLSMALVASIFPQWTLMAVVVHILFMGNFIYIFDKPYFCSYNCCTNYFFSIMLGTVFLFHFIATNDGPQKFKISFFYIVCGLENVACSIIFYLWVDKSTNRFWLLYLLVIWICFVCGLVFKVVYYRWFHPNITAKEKTPEKKKQKLEDNNGVVANGRQLSMDQEEKGIIKKRPLNNSIVHPVEDHHPIESKTMTIIADKEKGELEATLQAVTKNKGDGMVDKEKKDLEKR